MDVLKLAEDHPIATGGIVIAGGVAVLWLLGFFSKGSSQGSADQPSQAALTAYYGAEAAQAQAGAEQVINQQNNTAGVSIAQIQANADEAIATTNGATTVNSLAQEGYNNNIALVQQGYNDTALASIESAQNQALANLGLSGTIDTNATAQILAADAAAESEANTYTEGYAPNFSPVATEYVSSPYGNVPLPVYGGGSSPSLVGLNIGGLPGLDGSGDVPGDVPGDVSGDGSIGLNG